MWRDARWVAYQLADDSGEAQGELLKWSATYPHPAVADTLVAVLMKHPPGPTRGAGLTTSLGCFSLLLVFPLGLWLSAAMESLWPFVVAVVALCLLLCWQEIRRPKIARRAALMLARMNDSRAIDYLTQCWKTNDPTGQENEPIAEELTRLLMEAPPLNPSLTLLYSLCGFVERHFTRPYPAHPARDLTESEADLFLSIVRFLAACNARNPNPSVAATLKRTAHYRTPYPNRHLVAETALLLTEPHTITPPVAANAVLPTEPAQFVQQRRLP